MSSQQETNNFYQILNVSKDATDKEITRAYQLAVQTYRTNSLAAYSLFSEEESDDILRNITKAYMTLNDPINRAQYDEEIEKSNSKSLESNKDILELTNMDDTITNSSDELYLSIVESDVTTSLDNVKTSDKESDLSSERPSTEQPSAGGGPPTPTKVTQPSSFSKPFEDDPSTISLSQRLEARLNIRSNNREALNKKNMEAQKVVAEFLSTVTQFNGQVLKQIRELKSINLEEIAEETCVRKVYLIAIEEEDYLKLPDIPIYIKSFLSNYARCLGLPSEKVIADYMNIYKERSH